MKLGDTPKPPAGRILHFFSDNPNLSIQFHQDTYPIGSQCHPLLRGALEEWGVSCYLFIEISILLAFPAPFRGITRSKITL